MLGRGRVELVTQELKKSRKRQISSLLKPKLEQILAGDGKFKRKSKKNYSNDILIRAPKTINGIVTKLKLLRLDKLDKQSICSLVVYVVEKRKIQIGDKIAGRHGNKGVISKILSIADMPYLPDGTPFDMLLNPLGIPSRMNVGQVFEGLLNLAAINLKERYRILPFDEMQNTKSSEIIVYKKLYEACIKTKKNWLFNMSYPGKAFVFDGRTGMPFKQTVSIGFPYILKLIHLVKDKIHSRLTGPYSAIVNQPVKGKSRNGGQRFGEMEVWAIEGFGAAYSLQELLTLKSDDIENRSKLLFNLMKGFKIPEPNIPQAFKVLILELQSLGLDVRLFAANFNDIQSV